MNKKLLKELSAAHGMGGLTGALEVIERALPAACTVQRQGASLIATLQGEGERTILFDAHADEIGFVVTGVLDGGFVKVAKAGGIDLRTLPAAEVVVHGKRDLPGVFATLPPHLKKGEDNLPDLADMVIDTGVEEVCSLVSPGDRVTFRRRPAELQNGCLTGKSLAPAVPRCCMRPRSWRRRSCPVRCSSSSAIRRSSAASAHRRPPSPSLRMRRSRSTSVSGTAPTSRPRKPDGCSQGR